MEKPSLPHVSWIGVDLTGPHYWMHERSGVLAPVVKAFINGEALSPRQIMIMRAYLAQWILSPTWDENPYRQPESPVNKLQELRAGISRLDTVEDLQKWIDVAVMEGLDPL